MANPPDRSRLDRRLVRGALRPRHLAAVARVLVARRAWAAGDVDPPEEGSARGDDRAARLWRRIADQDAKGEPHPERAALGVLLAYQRQFLEDAEDVLHARLAAGRDGALHGRLAADQVWVRGRHVVLGAAAEHARGDLAEDLASLTVDLRARGAPRAAERLAAAYVAAAGDYDVYRVLAFYERDAACRLALAATAGEMRPWPEAALAECAAAHGARFALVWCAGEGDDAAPGEAIHVDPAQAVERGLGLA